jgi:hypothetical protein
MKRLVFGAIALALSSAVAAQTPAQPPLNLTCSGGGTTTKFSVATVHHNAHVSGFAGTTMVSGNASGNSTVTIPHEEGFSDQVDVQLFGGNDQIRLPRTTLPTFHGGDGGWFKLKNVVADSRSIRAEAAVNFLNHPKVYIDRVTGTISISGKDGDFAGQCQAIDANAPAKF